MTPERLYSTTIASVGLGLAGIAAATFNVGELGIFGTLLLLALLTSWLRIKLEPFGRITLIPLLVFLALQIASPSTGVLLAEISAIVGSRFIARNPWQRTFVEMGEEGICAFVAVLVLWSQRSHDLVAQTPILVFALAVLLYAAARTLLTMLAAYAREGIPVANFLPGAGGPIFSHQILMGAVAFGLAFVDRRFGFLAVPLATIALAESYYPAKLLSDQRGVLYSSLTMIAHAIDLKDIYTGKHAREVANIAVRIARTLRLPERDVSNIRFAGLLHDIGKIGVSGGIIRKPSKLTVEEESAMKRHPVIGADIMQPIELLTDAARLVRHHHEHYDGSGYPDGLAGEDIPMGSRIVFVADAFNAMTTDRPYRRARSKQEAMKILQEYAGYQFDRAVVRALESVIEVI
ncbi:MAG: HD-GYP domain-containing protein [Nitrososphaera sp.]